MQQESDKLYDLIKSLNRGEKTHFIKLAQAFSSANAKPKYLELYEKLDSMKTYDSQVLEKSFKGTNILKNLSKYKHELNNKILDSLSLYHTSKSDEKKLHQIMSYLPILWEKQQYKEFNNQLNSARKVAKKIESLEALIKLIDWEIQYQKRLSNKKTEANVRALIEKKEGYVKQLNDEYELGGIKEKIYLTHKRDVKFRQEKDRNELLNISKNKLLNSNEYLLTLNSLKKLHYIKSIINKVNGNYKLAYYHSDILVKIQEEEKPLNKFQYKYALCNSLIMCQAKENIENSDIIIEKLKKLLKNDAQNMDVFSLNTLSFLGLRYYLGKRQFSKSLDLIKEIEGNWILLSKNIYTKRLIAYCYNILIVYWFTGNLNKANNWLNRLLNDFESHETSRDIIHASRILQLAIYYDIENGLLQNQFESTRKLLDKKEQVFEKEVKKFFLKLIKATSKQESLIIFKGFYSIVYNIFKSKQEMRPQALEELLYWSYSKIVNKTPQEIYENDSLAPL